MKIQMAKREDAFSRFCLCGHFKINPILLAPNIPGMHRLSQGIYIYLMEKGRAYADPPRLVDFLF